MIGRFRKASALLATAAMISGCLIAASAVPASASSASGCENGCTSGFSSGPTTRTDGPFTLGVKFTTNSPGDLQHMCYPNDTGQGNLELNDPTFLSDGVNTYTPVTENQFGQQTCAYFYKLLPAGTYTVWYADNHNLFDSLSSPNAPDLGSPTAVTNITAVFGSGGMPSSVASNYGVNFTWYSAPNAPSPVAVTPTSNTSATFSYTGDSQSGATTPYDCVASVGAVTEAPGPGTSGSNSVLLTGLTSSPSNQITCSVHEEYLGITNGNIATASTYLLPPAPTGVNDSPAGPTSVNVGFTGDGAAGATFTATCTSTSGGTHSATGATSPIVVGGFTNVPTDAITCSVTEKWPAPASSTSAASATAGTAIVGVSGPGCTGTATAPTQVSAAAQAFPGAVVSWAPVTPDPAGCLVGYLITPSSGSAVLVTGHGTTTLVKGPFAFGSTVTFTVAAVTGSGAGPASAGVSVTIGTPAAASSVKATRVGKGALKIAFKAGSGNGAAISKFTATCGSKSASGKSSPLVVKGLTAGKSYTCSVTATNSRGTGKASHSAAVKA